MPLDQTNPNPEEMPTEEEMVETPAQDAAPAEEAQEAGETDELKAAKDQAEEYLNMAQRVQADFENYRRRTKATRAEAFEDGAREVIKLLLPVVDNLERAIQQESSDENLLTGVKLVYKQLMDALEKYVRNDFRMEKEYRDRLDAFFPVRDEKNCERTFKIVSEL